MAKKSRRKKQTHARIQVVIRAFEGFAQEGDLIALREFVSSGTAAITLKDGVVEQSNFGDFTVARITDMPEIAVHIVPSAEPPKGPYCPEQVRDSCVLTAKSGSRYRSLTTMAISVATLPTLLNWPPMWNQGTPSR